MAVGNISALQFVLRWVRVCTAAFAVVAPAMAHAQSIVMSEPTRVTLQSSSGEAGRLVLTASVATVGGGGVPAGTIQFIDETSLVVLGWAGVATPSIIVDRLSAGRHRIRADYSGTADFLPVVLQPAQSVALEIDSRSAPDVAVSSSRNPSVPGQLVTLTATVTCRDMAPAGSVTFRDGTRVLAAHIGLDRVGSASFTTSALANGSRAITVEYEGDAAHARTISRRLVQDVGDIRIRSSQRDD